MNKLSISSLAWMILSTACISLEDVPITPSEAPDGASDAGQDGAPAQDAGEAHAPLFDAGRDGEMVGPSDAQPPPIEPLVPDGGTQECNAEGFCVVSRFRPGSSIESDSQDVYVLEGTSADVLGNQLKDARLWKVQSSSKVVLASGFALAELAQLSGVSDGFVYWIDGTGATARVSSTGGSPRQVFPTPAYASGDLLWGARDAQLELRTGNGEELIASAPIDHSFSVGAACGDVFYEYDPNATAGRVSMRTRSNPALAVELAVGLVRALFCDARYAYVAHVQLGEEGSVERLDPQTKEKVRIALGFKHALRNQWWYSLRQYDPASLNNLTPSEGSMSVERWSTEAPGESLKLGQVESAHDITATATAVYVIDAAGNLFRKSAPE